METWIGINQSTDWNAQSHGRMGFVFQGLTTGRACTDAQHLVTWAVPLRGMCIVIGPASPQAHLVESTHRKLQSVCWIGISNVATDHSSTTENRRCPR